MSKIKTALTGIIIGSIIGYTASKIKQPEYTLREQNNTTTIYSKSQKESQPIYEASNIFFVGNNLNNLEGALYLTQHDITKKYSLLLDAEKQINQDLEKKLTDQTKKIRNRRIFDKIDETKDKIKFWYNDLKRKQLE